MAHAQYLTYIEYQKLGGTLSQTEFEPREMTSRKRVDRLTAERVQGMASVPEAVKRCVYALIGMEAKVGTEAQVQTPTATSFSTDGYSETYGNALNAETGKRAMAQLIGEYLYGEYDDHGVPLLYRGVRG